MFLAVSKISVAIVLFFFLTVEFNMNMGTVYLAFLFSLSTVSWV